MRNQTKLKYLSMLIVASVIALFTACETTVETTIAPTPTETITQNTTAPAQDKVSIQKDHVKVVLTPKAENVSIKLDADIRTPDAKSFPIVELVPKKITQEQVDNFLDTFFSDRVDDLTTEYERPLLKSEIEEEIKLREKWIADTKKLTPKNSKGVSTSIPKWEKQIEQYKEFMEKAFDDVSEIPELDLSKFSSIPKSNRIPNSSLELMNNELDYFLKQEIYHTKHISYSFEFNDSHYSVCAKQSDDPELNFFWLHKQDSYQTPFWYDRKTENYEDIPELKTTYTEAEALAKKAVEALGLKGMDLYKSSIYSEQYEHTDMKKPRLYYCFIYTWDVEGTNVTHTTQDFTSKFYLLIDDSGIVLADYNKPAQFSQTLPKEPELLPFDKIIDVACDAFESVDYLYHRFSINKNTDTIKTQASDIIIEKIEFGYMMIKDDAIDKNYLLIPVWDFFGREGHQIVTSDYGNNTLWETIKMSEVCQNRSLLTINAINGNVINRMDNDWRY